MDPAAQSLPVGEGATLGRPRYTLEELLDLFDTNVDNGMLRPAQIEAVLQALPKLDEESLTKLGHRDSSCPICYTSYLAVLAEEEMALAMESPAHPIETLGTTKLSQSSQCGHLFCRKDIITWVRAGHNSCPICRHPLIDASGMAVEDGGETWRPSGALLENLMASDWPPEFERLLQGVDQEQRGQVDEPEDRRGFSSMYS